MTNYLFTRAIPRVPSLTFQVWYLQAVFIERINLVENNSRIPKDLRKIQIVLGWQVQYGLNLIQPGIGFYWSWLWTIFSFEYKYLINISSHEYYSDRFPALHTEQVEALSMKFYHYRHHPHHHHHYFAWIHLVYLDPRVHISCESILVEFETDQKLQSPTCAWTNVYSSQWQ
jgi:hypothetical protein